jgi:hypothetical protein
VLQHMVMKTRLSPVSKAAVEVVADTISLLDTDRIGVLVIAMFYTCVLFSHPSIALAPCSVQVLKNTIGSKYIYAKGTSGTSELPRCFGKL